MPNPVVPRQVQLQIARTSPAFAYMPTREPVGFRFAGWSRAAGGGGVITLADKAGWKIRFVALRDAGACRAGMEKSFQLDGNKVYWSHTAVEQRAWRCLTDLKGRRVRLVASSTQPPSRFANVGLGQVAASGKRIAGA